MLKLAGILIDDKKSVIGSSRWMKLEKDMLEFPTWLGERIMRAIQSLQHEFWLGLKKAKKTPRRNTITNKAKFVPVMKDFSDFLLSAYNF